MLKVYDFETHTGYVYDPRVKSQVEEKYETSSRFLKLKASAISWDVWSRPLNKSVLLYGDFNLMA